MAKFRIKFTLLDIKPPTRLRRVQTEENIAAVLASVNDDHQLSIRRRLQQLGLCYATTWKILRKDLGVKPFKIQLVQELKPNDLQQCRIFWCSGLLESWPKIHFLCGLCAGGIIGPYFFKDYANRNVTVNGERYREMISNFFFAQNARA